jgi:hypothetical protein
LEILNLTKQILTYDDSLILKQDSLEQKLNDSIAQEDFVKMGDLKKQKLQSIYEKTIDQYEKLKLQSESDVITRKVIQKTIDEMKESLSVI